MLNPIEILAQKITEHLIGQLKLAELSMSVFNIQPGDTIIVKIKDEVSEQGRDRMEVIFRKAFPDIDGILFLGDGVDIEIVRNQIGKDSMEAM